MNTGAHAKRHYRRGSCLHFVMKSNRFVILLFVRTADNIFRSGGTRSRPSGDEYGRLYAAKIILATFPRRSGA